MATYSSSLPLRAQVLHATVLLVGFVLIGGAALLAASGGAGDLLSLPTGAGIPFGVLLVLAVPVSGWLVTNAMTLSRFGGAINVTFDPAVLAFLGWLAAGSLAAAGTMDGAPTNRALVTPAVWCLLAWIAGLSLSETLATGRHLVVRLFNVAQSAIGGAAFLLAAVIARSGVAHLLTGEPIQPQFGAWDVAGVLAATAAYYVITLVLTALSIAWSERQPLREVLWDESGLVAAAAVVAVVGVGVLAAVLLLESPWALALLAPVTAGIALAGRVGTEATSEHRRSEALFDAATRCQQTDDPDEVLQAVLEGIRTATGTQGAEIRSTQPEQGEIGLPVDVDGTTRRWFIVPPRKAGNSFLPADHRVLHTLATLARQSLASIAANERVRDAAERDGLTGLANRPTFMAALTHEAGVSGKTQRPASILFLDVDRFKQINDTYGHRTGDAVLLTVARRLQAAVRPADLVARLGGDEFAILLPDSGPDGTRRMTKRLEAALAAPVAVGGRLLEVRVSVGWASAIIPNSDAAERLLEDADAAMYADKLRRPADESHRGQTPPRPQASSAPGPPV